MMEKDNVHPLKPLPHSRLDPRRVRRALRRATPITGKEGALLDRISTVLVDRLTEIRITPHLILDLGCRTGATTRLLQKQWPKARIVSLVFEPSLVPPTTGWTLPWHRKTRAVAGEGTRLPFKRNRFDLVISNMALHWTGNPAATLREIRRVLAPDRPLLFTTVGEETLTELRHCLEALDRQIHGRSWPRVPTFLPINILGDLLLSTGFVLPVADREQIHLPFTDTTALLHGLRRLGAGNAAKPRPPGLMGKGYPKALDHLYRTRYHPEDKGISATLEILFGHAWKAPTKKALAKQSENNSNDA